MFNAERNLKARLTVVPMEGWQRGDWFDSTGRLWTNPSPNMRSLTEATLYPGVGLIEGTNVSVGRGTDTPFEVVGAPWIKPQELAAYLNERLISGVRFVPVTFTPTASRYRGRPCGGVNIVVLDRNAIDGPELGLELASALYRLYPGQYSLDKVVANGRTEQDGLMPLLANRAAFDALKAGQDPRRIALDWMQEDANFEQRRQRYLLYP
jgi:uncharacterized protein YbbC (DUF1343 family)